MCTWADFQHSFNEVLVHCLMLVRFERHGSTSPGLQVLPYMHSKVHASHFTAVAENWTHKGVKHVQRGRGCHTQDSAFREEAMLGFLSRDWKKLPSGDWRKASWRILDWRCGRNHPGACHYKPFGQLSDLLYKMTHSQLAPTL
jgi:hypothetical protein